MGSKYSNGKIYRIVSDYTDKVYVGSTIGKLNVRFSSHKKDVNAQLRYWGKSMLGSWEILQYADARIELIEPFPCISLFELRYREQCWIDAYGSRASNIQPAFNTKLKSKIREIPYSSLCANITRNCGFNINLSPPPDVAELENDSVGLTNI